MTAFAADVAVRPRRRRVRAVLGVYVAAVVVVLLSPVSPEAIVAGLTEWLRDEAGIGSVRQGWVELGANIALFVPLGTLITLAFRRPVLGLACALLLSAMAEWGQMLFPQRAASLRDVVANVLGAALGAGIAVGLRATIGRRARPDRRNEMSVL